MVKNLSAVQETRVHSPGWEDPLEKEMATHADILDWRIPWIEEPGGLRSMGSHRVGHFHFPHPAASKADDVSWNCNNNNNNVIIIIIHAIM